MITRFFRLLKHSDMGDEGTHEKQRKAFKNSFDVIPSSSNVSIPSAVETTVGGGVEPIIRNRGTPKH